MRLCLAALTLVACASALVAEANAARAWTLRLSTSGGIRGLVSHVEVRSDGRMQSSRQERGACAQTLAAPVLATIDAAVRDARPDEWQKRYALGGKAGADLVTSTLVLTRERENGPAEESSVTWSDDAPKLPDDLRKMVQSISPLGIDGNACTE